MIDELEEDAEEELERTAQEAVKAAVTDLGAELSAEEARADGYELMARRLEEENEELALENERIKKERLKNILTGSAVGAGAGVAFTSLLFLFFGGR